MKALLLFALAVILALAQFPARAQSQSSPHAFGLTYRLDLPADYSFEADTMLLGAQANQDFSTAWVMILADRGPDTQTTPFAQVGIIRDARRQFQLQAFTAYRHTDGPLLYQEGRFIADGWHQLRVQRSNGVIHLYLDGNRLYETPETAFFNADDRLYLQVGAELRTPGDHVVSYWRRFSETRNGLPTDATPRCFSSEHGLSFMGPLAVEEPGIFVASGIFDAGMPLKQFGNCHSQN